MAGQVNARLTGTIDTTAARWLNATIDGEANLTHDLMKRGGIMSKEHQEGYAGKHPESAVLAENVAAALKREFKDGQISCAAAHGVAKTIELSPADIGMALDLMEVRLIRCQLGLFGYTPEKRIVKKADQWTASLETEIRKALKDDRLPCADAWSIARQQGISRLAVGNVCEALGIKIRPCQLGAF